ncbi:hypothetical protein [Chryseobacterium mulctrae]|uniref:hypothetical protein n=1 Tax=Chryseobacterium mulctrae TaxID=2576777 RepID=UPI001115CD1E|nr:hypothetical protein [Chryseobacterium mulctrae]
MIKQLLESGVCFAVVQSYSYLTKAKIMENQQWEVIALESDQDKLRGLGFFRKNNYYSHESQKNPDGVMSKIMKQEDIREFKEKIPDYFDKVKETNDGKVWELKNYSFKRRLKAA